MIFPSIKDRIFHIINGIPADIWQFEKENIGRFVKENALAPAAWLSFGQFIPNVSVGQVNLQSRDLGSSAGGIFDNVASFNFIRIWPGFWGGIRTPHLHYNGDIYLLNAEQWNRFTTPVLKKLGEKIGSSQSISFDTFLDVSNSVPGN